MPVALRIPKNLAEVDNGKLLGFGAELSEDHPVRTASLLLPYHAAARLRVGCTIGLPAADATIKPLLTPGLSEHCLCAAGIPRCRL